MGLGARLKKFRLQNKESLQQVADAVKVSKAHIWELETGNSKNPSLALLRGLAEHFRISVATLVGEGIPDTDDADVVMFRDLRGLSPEQQKTIGDVIEAMKKRKRDDSRGEKD